MNEEIKALVRYRLEQADESLDSSRLLLENCMFRPSINRSYYAMFYIVLALLAIIKQGSSKHTGVTALFDREYIKKGIFDRKYSQWLHEALDLRQRADYREMFAVSEERATKVLEHAQDFVNGVKEYLNRSNLT